MFIVWGTKHKTREPGIVGDRCPTCRSVQPMVVTDHYEAGHIYWISLTQGTYKGSTMRCRSCGGEFHCDKNDYTGFLPPVAAQQVSVDELLQGTNPALLESVEMQANLDLMAMDQGGGQVADPDAQRFSQAVEMMRGRDDDEEGKALMLRLEQWQTLDAAGRTQLLEEVEAYGDQAHRADAAIAFIKQMSTSHPGYAGCVAGFLAFGAPLLLFAAVPATHDWLWGSLLVVAALIFGFVIMNRASHARIRGWVERKLIPMGDQRGVDFTYLIGILYHLSQNKDGVDEKIRDMSQNVELITAILIEHGRIEVEQEEASLRDV